MADEQELRRNLTVTHQAINRARLSAYLTIMGTRDLSTTLLVSSQQQLGQQVAVEGHRRSPHRRPEVHTIIDTRLMFSRVSQNVDPT